MTVVPSADSTAEIGSGLDTSLANGAFDVIAGPFTTHDRAPMYIQAFVSSNGIFKIVLQTSPDMGATWYTVAVAGSATAAAYGGVALYINYSSLGTIVPNVWRL